MKLSTTKTLKLLEKTPTSRVHEELEERVLRKYFVRKHRLQKMMIAGGIVLTTRESKVVYKRMDWDEYSERLMRQSEKQFSRKNRMQLRSFMLLVDLISPHLPIHYSSGIEGTQPIPVAVQLHMLLRWLAGASYIDVTDQMGLSMQSFYRLIHKVMRAIVECDSLKLHFPTTPAEIEEAAEKFNAISGHQVIQGCVGCLDGYLLKTRAPFKSETTAAIAHFSGHYRSYGINIQAVCDERSRFTFIDTGGVGSCSDSKAFNNTKLPELVTNLPYEKYLLADNAYTCTTKLLTPFSGSQKSDRAKSDFNFFLSQLRMKIECAFGMMTQRWRVLRSPVLIKQTRIWLLVQCIARLHNFCIDQNDKADMFFNSPEGRRRSAASEPYNEEQPGVGRPQKKSNTIRQDIVNRIIELGVARNYRNLSRNGGY